MTASPRVAVATTSTLAAEAAADVAAAGGNAVDCALAAAMVAMNTQPGVCSLAGGAYVTIGRRGEAPITIDGGVAVPGRNLARPGNDGEPLHMEYGGGVETIIGAASVGVPGALSACEKAWSRFGAVPWQRVMLPAIRAARDGFPLPEACHYYLEYSGRPIFARSADGEAALFDEAGRLRPAGALIRVPHLADSLEEIAAGGARVFYEGRIADAMVEHVSAGGGTLTHDDLRDYDPVERPALDIQLGDWRISCNPPPAVGGAVLGSLLLLCRDRLDAVRDEPADVAAILAAAQVAALGYRKAKLDWSDDVSGDARAMLDLAASGELLKPGMSAATVHTSAVDDAGLACAITSSAGYGAGEMPEGTGLWLNNCLGELELNRRGLDAGPPGKRLPSNMAPGIATNGSAVLAFGSPGADRITTALQQALLRHLVLGDDLGDAVDAPRLHVEVGGDTPRLSAEEGVDTSGIDLPTRWYPPGSMYFGGVAAARCSSAGDLVAAADSRRAGGIFLSGD